MLTTYAQGKRILIDGAGPCGGLPPGDAQKIFIPLIQRRSNKTRNGPGLVNCP